MVLHNKNENGMNNNGIMNKNNFIIILTLGLQTLCVILHISSLLIYETSQDTGLIIPTLHMRILGFRKLIHSRSKDRKWKIVFTPRSFDFDLGRALFTALNDSGNFMQKVNK